MALSRKAILEARELFQRAMDGNLRARADLMESLTTSDFPILLNAAYGRELQGAYAAIDPVWRSFSKQLKVPDFRKRKLVDILGGRGALEKVKEAAPYPARKASEAEREFFVEKYGARFPLTWEMIKNDDLGAFTDFPQRLATAARETEERIALAPLFNAAGTALSTFASARLASGVGTALSRDALNVGIAAIRARKDSDGRPVQIPDPILMVPTALVLTAQNIVNTIEIRRGSSSGAPGDTSRTSGNGLLATPTIVENPWLDVVAGGYANVATAWYLLPNPSTNVKPALGTAFMNGEETPDLRVKADAGNRLGGGALSPEDGSFDDDTVQYRVRHVAGSAALYNDGVYIGKGVA